MADEDEETQEPASFDNPNPIEIPQSKGSRRAFRNVVREISDDDSLDSVLPKILLDDVDKLTGELAEMREFHLKFYEADKNLAVYEEKFKTHTSVEILATATITIGSLLVGTSVGALITSGTETNATDDPTGHFWLLSATAILGALLLVCGILAKKIKL